GRPVVAQSCYWSLSVGAGVAAWPLSLHVALPISAAVPVIEGCVWFAGGLVAAGTSGVAGVVAVLVPAVLVAVTTASRVEPASLLERERMRVVSSLMVTSLVVVCLQN